MEGRNKMKFYDKFIKIENEYKLFDRKYNGLNYWEFVRSYVHPVIWEKALDLLPLFPPYKRNIRTYKINLKQLKNYFIPKKMNKLDILFLSQPRRFYQNGVFENPYVDPMADILSQKYEYLILEEPTWCCYVPTSTPHLFPVKSKNIIFTDLYEMKYYIRKILFKYIHRNEYKKILEEYEVIKNIFVEELKEYDLSNMDFKTPFIDCLIRIKLTYQETKKIIDKLNPKMLIVHYFPTTFKMMIINICNERGIKTVELQHGTVSELDPIHSKFKDNKVLKSTPKYFFGFGEKNVETTNFHTLIDNIKYVGYPFLENKLISEISKPDVMKDDKKYILIISQSLIGDKISEFASRLAEELKNNSEYMIIFKYHPNELKREFSCLNKKNIIQIKDLKNDVYSFQKYSTLQIGVSSTSLYEGIVFQLPTIILKNIKTSIEAINILDYISTGVYIEDDFSKIVSMIINKEYKKPLKKDVSRLWISNSENKVLEEVGKMLNEND